jgi:type VI secretion system protein ImpA
VATRAEALHLLEVAARYFEQNEPSSPLPLMLNRARGLANKTFLEILQDLAPDGFGQAQMIVQSRE